MTNSERDQLLIKMSGQIGSIETSLTTVTRLSKQSADHERRIMSIENDHKNEHSTRNAVFKFAAWVIGVGLGLAALVLQLVRGNT